MTKFLPFVYDTSGLVTNQKCFIITGKRLAFLTAFLNSSLFKFCFADKFPELQGKTRELSKIFMDEIPVMEVSDDDETHFVLLVEAIQKDISKEALLEIDNAIFDLYQLTTEEREYVHISAVPKIVRSIAFVCTGFNLIPIIIKMLLDCRVVLYMYSFK